jgi:hypothetical protein
MRNFLTGLAAAAVTISGLGLWFSQASAADIGISVGEQSRTTGMILACENGARYPIRPIAVSREADLVTGYMLRTGTGRAIHLRLVPMGEGYRYEGGGIWFDGIRDTAVLDWGTRHEVPCQVFRE